MNLFRLDNSSNVRRYFDLFSSFGLVPMIGRATNYTHNASTLIDQTWTNIVSHGCSSHLVTTLSVSSHIPTMCVFPDPYLISESGPITISSTDFNHTSLTNFKNDYDILCRNHVISLDLSDNSVDLAHSFSTYYNQLSLLYNKHFVKHKTLTNSRNNHTKPWVSPSLARSIHVKSILYKKWVASRGSSRESMAASDYRTYRAILRGLLVKSRDDYFTSKFLKCDNDIKKCWSVINSIRGKSNRAIYPSCVKIDSGTVTDPRAISNQLNKYFTSVASDLNTSKFGTSRPDYHKYSRFMPKRVSSSLFLSPVSSDEIFTIIKGLKPKKSGDFSSLCLKHLNFLFSTDFSTIINKCMAAGVFPDELKHASVHPLHKGGDTNTLSNYRPISLLPILSKIFEKCLHKRVIEFLDVNSVISKSQFGFLKGRSTTQALHEGVGSAVESLDNNRFSLGLFLDLSKAFDTLHHDILVAKLEHYGIRGTVLKLFKSFLSGRSQTGRSTTQALHEGVGSAVESLDNNRFSLGLFLDLSKAFDTLHHDILVAKLEHYGIRGNVLKLFKSFLSGRSQTVKIGDKISDPLHVSCGVPQGSTLGPLLFLLYINDIVNLPCGSDSCSTCFILFADDTSIFISGRSAPEVQWVIDKLMALLKDYFDANFLHVNTSKTKFMHFSSPQATNFPSHFTFCFDGTTIEQVKQFKFLGIEISDSLTWEAHIKSVSTKLHRNLGSIYRLRKSLPKQLKIPVYYALFQSHINYSISVWGSGGCMNKLLPIFKAQKPALRCLFSLTKVPGSFGKPGTKLTFNNLDILTVHHLYHMAVLSKVHQSKLNDDNSIVFSSRKPNLAIIPRGITSPHKPIRSYSTMAGRQFSPTARSYSTAASLGLRALQVVSVLSSGEEDEGDNKEDTDDISILKGDKETADTDEISILKESHSSDKDSCSICLGAFTNRSFINECFHAFCYYCILQWSEVAQTCPLCKKSFTKIIHDVTSIRTYKETMVHKSERAVQIPHTVRNSFRPIVRYRTTQRDGEVEIEPDNNPPNSQPPPTLRREKRRLKHRPRDEEEVKFLEDRLKIYTENQWAKPLVLETHRRLRRASPTFYVNFEGAKHRLFQFIRCELEVLLNDNADTVYKVIERIWKLLDKYPIKSDAFHRKCKPHLGDKTGHFCHELYMFAISPYDWKSYMRRVQYGPAQRSRWDSSPVRYIGGGGEGDCVIANVPWDIEEEGARNKRKTSDSSVEIIEQNGRIGLTNTSPIVLDEYDVTPVYIDLDNLPPTPTHQQTGDTSPQLSILSPTPAATNLTTTSLTEPYPTTQDHAPTTNNNQAPKPSPAGSHPPKRSVTPDFSSSGKGKEKRRKAQVVVTPDVSPIRLLMNDTEPSGIHASMLRRLVKKENVTEIIKQVDAFPKVDDSYVTTNSFGGLVTLLCWAGISLLLYSEIMDFLTPKMQYRYTVDKEAEKSLDINIDMTIAMKCNLIGADVLDIWGQDLGGTDSLKEELVPFELSENQKHFVKLQKEQKTGGLNGGAAALHDLIGDYGVHLVPRQDNGNDAPKDACRLYGKIPVSKVKGNFHILSGRSVKLPGMGHAHLQFGEVHRNFSHRIDGLTFGDRVGGMHYALDGEHRIAPISDYSFQYFIQRYRIRLQRDLNFKSDKFQTTQLRGKMLARQK
eukprot:sb/3460750/